ncbi:hypothetical protein [Jeotgalibacillus terrae]|uniref:Uncharacterized protein n=1 Tax=Jeotgalibacillus terrae TaxID=587735 RepID=A0ABW5ZKN2_9BACL|nr:hypothetical protein [Jeotgalibacillus terrae]MBM7578198.1 putative lysophospholipase L1 biosynthesis ABC-type transport system permease subunit [Jeotgalibacillus terrae]
MIIRILIGIVVGGLLGFISSLLIGSAMNASDETALFAIYFGVVSGLLVCLIIEINKLNNTK